jgi:hypothetical protein
MPFKSDSQRRFMFAAEDRGEIPEGTAERWAHHTKNIKHLPEHVRHKKSDDVIASLARAAAEQPFVEKLARDAEMSVPLVYRLAETTGMGVVDFVKTAYADVDGFIDFVKVMGGRVKLAELQKRGGVGELLSRTLKHMQLAGDRVGERLAQTGSVGKGLLSAGEAMAEHPKTSAGLGAAGAGAALGGSALMKQPAPSATPQGPGEAAIDRATNGVAQQNPGVAPLAPPMPAQPAQPAPQQPQGMSTGMKVGLGAGAAGLGAGAYMMARHRKKKSEGVGGGEEKTSHDIARDVMRRALVKKAAQMFRVQSARVLCAHLDKLASFMPLQKQAAVRTVQKEVAQGRPLSVAIKLAYPHLAGEKRGILAARLVESALRSKRADSLSGPESLAQPGPVQDFNPGVPVTQTQTFSGTPGQGLGFMRQQV